MLSQKERKRLTLFLLFSLGPASLLAQEAESTTSIENDADKCDRPIASLDRTDLNVNPDQAIAQAMAKLVRNSSACVQHLEETVTANRSGIGGLGQGLGQGQGQSSSMNSSPSANQQNISFSNQSSSSNMPSLTATATGGAPTDGLSTNFAIDGASSASRADIFDPVTGLLTTGHEMLLDDYSRTIYEAYKMEQDPGLKDALGGELRDHFSKLNTPTVPNPLSTAEHTAQAKIAQYDPKAQVTQVKGKISPLARTANAITKNVIGILDPDDGLMSRGDELALDDYAKTLYEAYQAEEDPERKAALAEQLNNYVSNNK